MAARLLFRRLQLLSPKARTMTTCEEFKQSPHKLLVVPGPIEVADNVLFANAHPSMSHVSPEFIPVLGDCIRMTRQVLFSKTGQPFLVSGSGTLGWDQVAANLIEQGESALVLNTGYFGDSFADCLEAYGASVTQLKAPIGGTVPLAEVEKALKARKYKLITFTHVDTSTGVLSPAAQIAALTARVSPSTLIIADCVCSVASETIRFDAWGLDVVLSASQKGLGTPPGLSVLLASQRAIKVFQERKTRVAAYYASWAKWLPIMKAYEEGRAAYFATPPVNLVYAFREALLAITGDQSSVGAAGKGDATTAIEERLDGHRASASRIRESARALGLEQVARSDEEAANGMTALYFPPGIGASDIIPRLAQRGIVVAGGLHAEIRDKYFRIGHMGETAVNEERGDIEKIITALTETLAEARAQK